MSRREQQMPISLHLIRRETGVSRSALKRHLKLLSNSDLIFFEGDDILLSYSGLYYEQRS
jgi:predicted transcriptional regulator